MAQIVKATDDILNLCKQALANSKVIAVPTETVYGLAGNALDERAIKAIYKIKGRPLFNPLIIHTDCLKNAEKYAIFNPIARKLAEHFWPGPLTMILPKKEIVSKIVTANLNSVAIRCPKSPTFLKLLKSLNFPLAAPSANPFGYVSPTSAEHVNESLGNKVDYILDGGTCKIGIESTIVDLRNPHEAKVLRPGPIAKDELEKLAGIKFESTQGSTTSKCMAPGMLKSHYSPTTQLKVTTRNELEQLVTLYNNPQKAYIFHRYPEILKCHEFPNVYSLSKNGEDADIAHNLYKLLREIDAKNFKIIYIEAIDGDKGLKAALKDRINKAAS